MTTQRGARWYPEQVSHALTDTEDDAEQREARRPSCASRPGALIALFERGRPVAAERWSLHDVDAVWLGRGDALGATRVAAGFAARLEVTLGDRRVSRVHARLHRVDDQWLLEDAG